MTAVPEAVAEEPKRFPAKKLRRFIYWLTLDWIHLHDMLPTPAARGEGRRAPSREYGHPAEWASDTARQIVDILTSWHDLLAEHRGETRPPNRIVHGTHAFRSAAAAPLSERRRLVAAWRYIEPRCEELCELVAAEALQEIPDLHRRINSRLGASKPKYTLPIPCPNDDCNLLTLMRIVGVGQDFISCESCGYMIRETYYPLLIRMTLDALIRG